MTLKEFQNSMPPQASMQLRGKKGCFTIFYKDPHANFSYVCAGANIENICTDLILALRKLRGGQN